LDDPLIDEIRELKERRKAVILAHSYQPPVIQDMADFVGDSLDLSRRAAATDAEVIVFCGVLFMAETAHILSPEKTVLLPVPDAGCPLADSITEGQLRGMQAEHPEAETVVYINSSAGVKALSYSCCTSANSVEVVESVPSEEVIFAPDLNLGTWVAGRTGKRMHIWKGDCFAHSHADLDHMLRLREEHPDAELLVHPETSPRCWEAADHVLGTGGMIEHVRNSGATTFLIGTEEGMVYRLSTLFPDREFIAAGRIHCYNMKKIEPLSVLRSLRLMEPVISLEPGLREAARAAVVRMTELG
jgi:quinolinate synthase